LNPVTVLAWEWGPNSWVQTQSLDWVRWIWSHYDSPQIYPPQLNKVSLLR
jgi:hypothetical protein